LPHGGCHGILMTVAIGMADTSQTYL
jgi:hypothetical protein